MESIKENQQKSKGKAIAWAKGYKRPILLSILGILLAVASFGLGRLSIVVEHHESGQVYIPQTATVPQTSQTNTIPIEKTYVASKSGKSYYLPSCAGVSRIKEDNKVYFATKQAAEAAGYAPATNCQGLK